MARPYYTDEFVYGWPQKICGCSQIIESCSYCCGSFTACSSCTYCYGRAYIEVPCPHSRAPRREATTESASSSSPPTSSPSSPRASVMTRYQHNQDLAQLSVRGVSFDASFVDRVAIRHGDNGSHSGGSSGSHGGRNPSRRDPDHGLPPSPSSSTASSASSSSSSSPSSPSSPKRRPRFGWNKKGSSEEDRDSGSKSSR
ncbi:uncharacterized protein SPSK_09824 [Sporothrix schenckii 1099-18]|uniref:Uncharacterized protein n=1 Tax=Sporothrix schenckii 1099-18 TaxID=1397361 RepID=A0A0F2M4D8_SPOSC|nr:uncharacterized protein SPSK_09824 [Sporothrix schenckii 1099-18]KJR84578.1 hypothetical protein SPSK_09824 [Sporothrix schenckii 1099-18]